MARGADFLKLYQEFKLEPGASIDDLKLAYRRRVAVLHPDRFGARDPISGQLATEQLKMLTALYEAGIRFHRQHGRLPGAIAPRREADVPERAEPAASPLNDLPPSGARTRRPLLRFAILIGLCAVIAWLVSESIQQGDPPRSPAAPLSTNPPRVFEPVPPRVRDARGIHVGMAAADVLAIEGEPVMGNDYRWDYGPSWIRFDKGRVVDWHSSPLRPLRVSRSPASDAAAKPDSY